MSTSLLAILIFIFVFDHGLLFWALLREDSAVFEKGYRCLPSRAIHSAIKNESRNKKTHRRQKKRRNFANSNTNCEKCGSPHKIDNRESQQGLPRRPISAVPIPRPRSSGETTSVTTSAVRSPVIHSLQMVVVASTTARVLE
jgi:hypothetical protein